MPTRNPIKTWFITFPQWPDRKRKDIKVYFSTPLINYTDICICLEKHNDKGHHFHVLLKCPGITHSALLRHFTATLPKDYKRIHFKPVRSVKQSLAYCHKEDEHPLLEGFSTPSSFPTVRETVQGMLKSANKFPRIQEHIKVVRDLTNFITSECKKLNISDTAKFSEVASLIKYNEYIMTGLQWSK